MLSAPRRFGAVVSETVRYHSYSRVRLPFQPYVAAGSSSPAPTAESEHDQRLPAYCPCQPRQQDERVRFDEHRCRNRRRAATSPRPVVRRSPRQGRSSATGRLNCPNASSLTRNLPFSSNTSQNSTRSDSRRSGRAATDSRTNPQAMITVRVNHATSAVLGQQRERPHDRGERRQVLVLIVAVRRTVERLVSKEAHRRPVRHREVDELVAFEANQPVQARGDQYQKNDTDEDPRRPASRADASLVSLRVNAGVE